MQGFSSSVGKYNLLPTATTLEAMSGEVGGMPTDQGETIYLGYLLRPFMNTLA